MAYIPVLTGLEGKSMNVLRFVILAVGLVSAQRIEWLIRARRMLAAARAV